MFGLSEKDLQIIQDLGRNHPQIEKIIVFGSRAMGNYKRGSDVDLAIMGDLSARDIWRIEGLLNDELPTPYFYDVLGFSLLTNEALRAHILEVGQVVYER